MMSEVGDSSREAALDQEGRGHRQRTRMTWAGVLMAGAVAAAGCRPETPPENYEVVEEPLPEPEPPPEPPEDEEQPEEPLEPVQEDPQFTPGMSVQEAMDAVPASADRLNVEQERLAEPLTNPELYEPCKLSASQHFTAQVAVWEGKAVGMDVSTTPKNEQLEQCIREQVQTVEWEDKVKSLNTVQFNY